GKRWCHCSPCPAVLLGGLFHERNFLARESVEPTRLISQSVVALGNLRYRVAEGMQAIGEGLRSFWRPVPRLPPFAWSCAFRTLARDITSWVPACAGMTSSGFTYSCVVELIHGVNPNRPRHTDLACRN